MRLHRALIIILCTIWIVILQDSLESKGMSKVCQHCVII